MASSQLPAVQTAHPVGYTQLEDDLLWALAEGYTGAYIAKHAAQGDRAKQKLVRQRVRRLLLRTDVREELEQRVQIIHLEELGAVNKALRRKARAGRVDAIKLYFEASGFYNPRLVEHQHSGEITITIKGAARPTRTEEEYIGEAEVVED